MRSLVVLLTLVLCAEAWAQDMAFVLAGALPQPSGNASAIALPDGDALLFGSAPSAQRFDHVSGSMAIDGALLQSHVYVSAQLLFNGKVLLASGAFDPNDASAELYDPTARASRATGSMTTARWNAAIARLGDGRVLFAGGTTGNAAAPIDSVEAYDPSSGRFAEVGHLLRPRAYAAASALPDGSVLVVGGLSTAAEVCPHSNGTPSCSAERCDPVRGTCTYTGSMSGARWSAVATALKDGRVLVSGGWTAMASSQRWADGFEVYDPASGTFTAVGTGTGQYRLAHTASVLPDGEVLLVGGVGIYSNVLASSALVDPVTFQVRAGPSLSVTHDSHAAALLSDGRVLVAGGETYDAAAGARETTTDAELFIRDAVFSNGFDGSG